MRGKFSGFSSVRNNCIIEVSSFLENLDAVRIKAQSSLQAVLDLRQFGVVRQLKPYGPVYKLKCSDTIILLPHFPNILAVNWHNQAVTLTTLACHDQASCSADLLGFQRLNLLYEQINGSLNRNSKGYRLNLAESVAFVASQFHSYFAVTSRVEVIKVKSNTAVSVIRIECSKLSEICSQNQSEYAHLLRCFLCVSVRANTWLTD